MRYRTGLYRTVQYRYNTFTTSPHLTFTLLYQTTQYWILPLLNTTTLSRTRLYFTFTRLDATALHQHYTDTVLYTTGLNHTSTKLNMRVWCGITAPSCYSHINILELSFFNEFIECINESFIIGCNSEIFGCIVACDFTRLRIANFIEESTLSS